MSCEEASRRLAEAMNAYLRVKRELAPLLLSHIAASQRRGQPTVPATEKSERMQRLMAEQEEAFERYQAALDAFAKAKKSHHN